MSIPKNNKKGTPVKLIVLGIAAVCVFIFAVPNSFAQVSGSLWKLSAGTLLPINSSWSVTIPQLGGGGTQCLQVTNAGLIQTTGSACGSGGGGGTGVATTSLLASYPVTVTKTAASITYGLDFSTTTESPSTSKRGSRNLPALTFVGTPQE